MLYIVKKHFGSLRLLSVRAFYSIGEPLIPFWFNVLPTVIYIGVHFSVYITGSKTHLCQQIMNMPWIFAAQRGRLSNALCGKENVSTYKGAGMLLLLFTNVPIVIFTGNIEAILYSKVHSVLECWKHTTCFIEPIQLLPHPGLCYGRSTHIIAFYASLLPNSR